jgi:hypothetical protein
MRMGMAVYSRNGEENRLGHKTNEGLGFVWADLGGIQWDRIWYQIFQNTDLRGEINELRREETK